MNFKIASLKLTLFYLMILMVVSLCFSVVVYRLSSDEINRGLLRQNTIYEQVPPENIPKILRDLDDFRQNQIQESTRRLSLNLIYFNLIIFVLAGVGSYLLAQKTLKPIEETMELQAHFTADASHELRTPLTAIKSETEVLLREKKITQKDMKKLLKSNLEEIKKLEDLSNGLLELANYDANRLKKDKLEKLSLEKVIKYCVNKIEPLAAKKNIKFDLSLKPVTIFANENLEKLFCVILENAIKYSPKNSKIKVESIKDYKFAKVTISDQGIGIKKEDLPHIFNRFYRADFSRSKEKFQGYGLGLAIAKKIAEQHSGQILVQSKYGRGTTFTIKLPIK